MKIGNVIPPVLADNSGRGLQWDVDAARAEDQNRPGGPGLRWLTDPGDFCARFDTTTLIWLLRQHASRIAIRRS